MLVAQGVGIPLSILPHPAALFAWSEIISPYYLALGGDLRLSRTWEEGGRGVGLDV